MMEKYSRLLITGSTGMVGGALYQRLKEEGYTHLTAPGITEERIDLRYHDRVSELFNRQTFDYVFHLAARVSGIQANINRPVQHLNDNILMDSNIFDACYKFGVKKVLYLGSSCIYPKNYKQPLKEEYLMEGKLEETNAGYALSKIVGIELLKSYKKQYGLKSTILLPCNIYGTGDHFDLENSHVLSALVKKFVDAKSKHEDVTLWGTGKARREFVHVEDVVDAVLHFFPIDIKEDFINIGPGKDISIKELSDIVIKLVGFIGEVNWDKTRPEGMMRKMLDVSRMESYGFSPKKTLEAGIAQMIREYRGFVKK